MVEKSSMKCIIEDFINDEDYSIIKFNLINNSLIFIKKYDSRMSNLGFDFYQHYLLVDEDGIKYYINYDNVVYIEVS